MNGLRILDLSRVLAGPWATMQLADQGAKVIKVEPPSGDETRGYGPFVGGESTYFLCANRNKQSIVLDLKSAAGQEVLRELLAWADVVVENFRPGVAARLGLGWAQLHRQHPDLVYVAIHGFGDEADSEWTSRPGYDLVLQASGGAASLTGSPDGPPTKSGTSVADLLTGLYAVQAVLLGLLHRERDGGGQKIVVNMLQVQATALAYHATRCSVAGQVGMRRGNTHAGLVPYRFYECADGWLAVGCGNDGMWQRLRRTLSIEDRPEWKTNAQRLVHRDAVDTAVQEALRGAEVVVMDKILADAGVPAGPVHTVDQVIAHPVVEMVSPVHPVLGPTPMPGPGVKTATTLDTHTAPPGLGAHQAEVLASIGLADQTSRLASEGAFGQPK
ncbi:MAG: CoA transferase [Proteobacteria bacterium]|nr:CoA transferase [Pseudomonadota bacterium]